jgi:hypothetical protein
MAREVQRLRGVVSMLEAVANAVEEGRTDVGAHVDDAIVQLRGIRAELFGPRRLPGSAKQRLLAHLERRSGEWVRGEELAEVAGISEWARRVRELREAGHAISEEDGAYLLDPYAGS